MTSTLEKNHRDYVLYLQKTRDELFEQLRYWLPVTEPYPKGSYDNEKWHKAKRLINTILEKGE